MFGWEDVLVVFVLAMLIFGPGKLSGTGKALGTAIRDFREAMKGEDESSKKEKPQEASPKDTSNPHQ